MLRRALAGFVLVLLAAASRLDAADLPAPPEGFTWKKIDSIKAFFLVPLGWHYLEETKDDIRGIFISKEPIRSGGEFSTGLTINVQKVKGSASESAMKAIAHFTRLGTYEDLRQAETGVMKLYGARVHVTADPPSFTEVVTAIGNDKTGTLYILMFESPDPSWDGAWKTGQVMLSNFLLDDEF
jgi:hypothetical protein